MKLLKLTAYFSFLSAILLTTSCEKEAERQKVNVYTKDNIMMTGAQNRPVSTATSSATLSVSYDKRVNFLEFRIQYFGLTGVPTGISLYGPVPESYIALNPNGTPASPIWSAPSSTLTGLTAAGGTYTGSILIDGVALQEQKLLNNLYYFSIRTAAWPGGEIRGQVKFQ